ncbi:DUF3472 domain-containing protein [Pseudoalteromonas piscicida]|uniref:DUF5077 domain-containing protein n=1 Tax=Pseudoalteromonas piscicida TaxID=43662 RepID=A0A2A5JND6_PSEO7|nr:DUF3472 domain-containing protein [Pseudoalteromonas piscicida]PCK30771.1 hypothetical protein CEX98_15990 [Pseudoalteromonas piscicida]
MKNKIMAPIFLCASFLTSAQESYISSYGNAWVNNDIDASSQLISQTGIEPWQDKQLTFNHYFYANNVGTYTLYLHIDKPSTPSTLLVAHNSKQVTLNLDRQSPTKLKVGEFKVSKIGYQTVQISGVTLTNGRNSTFPAITGLTLDGEAMTPAPNYVKEDFYWGRRGPSVHLNYPVPDNNKNYNWFYNEVTVPSGYDPQGSYFMANGFGEGYFGIQVNSATERRVLFSVWSPYHTDDPSTIPDNLKIKLLDKGEGVYVGQFGNEGSGGQSYLRYQWQPDTTYRFLVNIQPSTNHQGHTEYRGYFYAPEVGQWQLIAAFSRPETNTYVARPHSFLENFIPAAGQLERKAFYNRQFLRDTDGNWVELNKARFTYDATAAKGSRLDYQGGEAQGGFYLRNTGFFSGPTPYLSEFNRVNSNNAPVIPWQSLQAHP